MERKSYNSGQPCSDREELLILFAAGQELDPSEEAEVREHVAHCADCAAALEREGDLLRNLASHHAEPDGILLASCRARLNEALDRQEEGGWMGGRFGTLLPASWISPRPAWSAALLLAIGFSVGIFGPRWLGRYDGRPSPAANSPADPDENPGATSEPVASSLGTLDLHTADVAGINVIPTSTGEQPQVELQLRAQRPVTLQGTVDNDDVKRVLLYILRNSDRFDPDIRIDAVDLLRARSNDPDVRTTLCHAVHTDHNTAVRLKALDALNGAEPQELVRKTLLDALTDDRNPGVRIEAINALRSMAEKGQVTSDEHMLSVLRERMEKDPNTYIRLQSAAAVRDLGPRAKF
jgi:HEAT repeats/Putative zinc-finger